QVDEAMIGRPPAARHVSQLLFTHTGRQDLVGPCQDRADGGPRVPVTVHLAATVAANQLVAAPVDEGSHSLVVVNSSVNQLDPYPFVKATDGQRMKESRHGRRRGDSMAEFNRLKLRRKLTIPPGAGKPHSLVDILR